MLRSKKRPHVDRCLNCGAATPSAFCAECGQEAVDAQVSFGDQIADFVSEVGSVESRLPQTMAALVSRPGALTRAYNAGQRVRYVTPLKLYLFASVVFFLVASFGSQSGPPLVTLNASNDHGAVRSVAELDAMLATDSEMPPFAKAALRRYIESPEGFAAALLDTISKATLVLVPIHALLLKALYRRPRRLYGEHVVFSLHVHAFGYLAYAVAGLLRLAFGEVHQAFSELAFLGTAAYLVLAARTAYGEGLGRSLVKTGAIAIGYIVAMTLTVAAAAAITFARL